MPKLDEIKVAREQKSFKKRSYRPWDLDGDGKENSKSKALPSSPTSLIEKKASPISMNNIIEIPTAEIKNWDYHDRPENELGDLEALANEFKEIGQLQPCIVRELKDHSSGFVYELIVGERRWRAAQIADLPLKVVVKDLSDSEAAIMQASENYNRQDLSDFARGISYSKLIDEGIINAAQLTKALQISKQQISRLLSFGKIPKEIIESVKDMSLVSARTAEHIKQLSNKGELYIEAIISCSEKIREGKVGYEKLNEYVENFLNTNFKTRKTSEKLFSRNGMHLFTIKNHDGLSPSFQFNKETVNLLKQKNIDIRNIAHKITQILEDTILNETN